MPQLQFVNRGGEADYVLGTSLGWGAFDVVRWHGVEEISRPFEYDIVLARDARSGPVDIHELVDGGATFRIATEERWRSVHGLVAEAELIEATSTLLLYRVVLVPHLWRALYRRRCRTFVEQSLKDIVGAVLENRAPKHPQGLRGLPLLSDEPKPAPSDPSFGEFDEPLGRFRWSLIDDGRVTTPRRMVVQYNESDFAFLSRLLEAEGLSYFFEHTANEGVMTLTDRPGRAPLFERDEAHELVGVMQGGDSRRQEVIRAWRPARRMRSAAVIMRDYAWRKSLTLLEAKVGGGEVLPDELEHYEFPAADEDEPAKPGAMPATIQLERYQAEKSLSEGLSTVRTHEPGFRFKLEDRAGLRGDAELLAVGVETYAAQLMPEGTLLDGEPFGFAGAGAERGAFFESRFRAVPAGVTYRPERSTSPPRIDGVQTAQVTAEEMSEGAPPELNSDSYGRVRVRFPWDQRPADGTASSKWIRVSQPWAGAGFGGMFVPRVGHEVLVAFERGDPDRPIVVGRLYNEQNRPPYMEANTTKSTVKSDSVYGDGKSAEGFNEFRFDDLADKEQVFLHAQRNLDEVVLANHTTTVGGDQSNSVAGSQSNSVGGDRSHSVEGTEFVTVGGNRTTVFRSNESHTVAGNRATDVGGTDALTAGKRETHVESSDGLKVDATRDVEVDGNHSVTTHANYHSIADANHTFGSTNMYITQAGEFQVNASTLWLNVGGASLRMAPGLVSISNGAGASIALLGGLVLVTSGSVVSMSGSHQLSSGGGTNMNSGGDTNVSAATIKLNG